MVHRQRRGVLPFRTAASFVVGVVASVCVAVVYATQAVAATESVEAFAFAAGTFHALDSGGDSGSGGDGG